MTLLPEIIRFNTDIETFKVGFFGKHHKAEDIYIYWYDLKDNTLISRYTREFHSSVLVHDYDTYEKFAQTYTVISGGWYGIELGGRWNTFKRTDGEIRFDGIENFNQNFYSKSIDTIFTISKKRFSNFIGIEINNETAGHITFICRQINIIPSNKIYLHHREENRYINASEILQPGGLGLIESKFIR